MTIMKKNENMSSQSLGHLTSPSVIYFVDELTLTMENLHISDTFITPITVPAVVENGEFYRVWDPVKKLYTLCMSQKLKAPKFRHTENAAPGNSGPSRHKEHCFVKGGHQGWFCSYGISSQKTSAKIMATKIVHEMVSRRKNMDLIIDEEVSMWVHNLMTSENTDDFAGQLLPETSLQKKGLKRKYPEDWVDEVPTKKRKINVDIENVKQCE